MYNLQLVYGLAYHKDGLFAYHIEDDKKYISMLINKVKMWSIELDNTFIFHRMVSTPFGACVVGSMNQCGMVYSVDFLGELYCIPMPEWTKVKSASIDKDNMYWLVGTDKKTKRAMISQTGNSRTVPYMNILVEKGCDFTDIVKCEESIFYTIGHTLRGPAVSKWNMNRLLWCNHIEMGPFKHIHLEQLTITHDGFLLVSGYALVDKSSIKRHAIFYEFSPDGQLIYNFLFNHDNTMQFVKSVEMNRTQIAILAKGQNYDHAIIVYNRAGFCSRAKMYKDQYRFYDITYNGLGGFYIGGFNDNNESGLNNILSQISFPYEENSINHYTSMETSSQEIQNE